MPENTIRIGRHTPRAGLDRLVTQKVTEILNAMLDASGRRDRRGVQIRAFRRSEGVSRAITSTCPGLVARRRKRTDYRATGGHGQKCTISRSICYQRPFAIL